MLNLDAAFFEKLSRLRLAMGHKSSMNMTGNRKSVQKGSSTEFSDFREYMPGDDIRRIDWNAYGRLDRLYVKEYMEEKEAVVSILLDTSASMDYGEKKKSELACKLAAAFAYLGLNNMDRVFVYDTRRMNAPFRAGGGKKTFHRLAEWLDGCTFEGETDLLEAVRNLPAKGPGVTLIISDFLQEAFVGGGLNEEKETPRENIRKMLRFLEYRKQKTHLLHVFAEEELSVNLSGTRNFIDMEDESTLRITLDSGSIRVYEKALADFMDGFKRECARGGATYTVCSAGKDFYQLLFQDLRTLYDI